MPHSCTLPVTLFETVSAGKVPKFVGSAPHETNTKVAVSNSTPINRKFFMRPPCPHHRGLAPSVSPNTSYVWTPERDIGTFIRLASREHPSRGA
jgi:hypothetical protein